MVHKVVGLGRPGAVLGQFPHSDFVHEVAVRASKAGAGMHDALKAKRRTCAFRVQLDDSLARMKIGPKDDRRQPVELAAKLLKTHG